MKTNFLMSWIFTLICCYSSFGQTENPQTTGMPYFTVPGENGATPSLPLLSTDIKVNITGVIADAVITQTYHNSSKSPVEAVYVFPMSDKSAVYDLKMTIGDRVIQSVIKEKQQARKVYEQARDEGRHATLLEQDRPNVFTVNVANLMPGDTIGVVIRYTEIIIPDEGVYSLSIPATVGPRYISGRKSTDRFPLVPYEKNRNMQLLSGYDITLDIHSDIPVKWISSTTHPIRFFHKSHNHWTASLDCNQVMAANRDFVVNYSLKGKSISSGVHLYNQKDENFFMAMLQPPVKVRTEEIPPREYIFIVDVSGSMNGFPLDVSKKLIKNLVSSLRPSDMFNIVLFAGDSGLLSPASVSATKQNIDKAILYVDNQPGAGGTELLHALNTSLGIPRPERNLSRSFVLITDGYISAETESFNLIRNHLNEANLFAFGIGSSVNRYLINGLAACGKGQPFVITGPEVADSIATKFRKYISSPVLSGIQVSFKDFNAYDLNYQKYPDLMSDRPIVITGKYKGFPQGQIIVSGVTGKKRTELTIDVSHADTSSAYEAIKYLWAREKIGLLSDFSDDSKNNTDQEITQLGLKYNLMTPYTSFVAIDKQKVVNKDGTVSLVRQPSPMPFGVSDLAVGASFDLTSTIMIGSQNKLVTGLLWSCLTISMIWIFVLILKYKKTTT